MHAIKDALIWAKLNNQEHLGVQVISVVQDYYDRYYYEDIGCKTCVLKRRYGAADGRAKM